MNRGSTAGFNPSSVYIGFGLFVLQESRSGDESSMLWRVRGRLVSWANSSVGMQFCPTPPVQIVVDRNRRRRTLSVVMRLHLRKCGNTRRNVDFR